MSSVATPNLIKILINAAEKASNIARTVRAEEKLLSLLIQEKSSDEANPRFVQDFKTLADVLIQETIRNDVGNQFPEIRDNINGEESPTFTNRLGESATVVIGENVEETASCLETLLNGDRTAANVLATEVHKIVDYSVNIGEIPSFAEDFNFSQLGIWIDPIDATAEYISGDSIFTNFPGITSTGLDCVTVLIGAYNRLTGVPVIGIVSQPFHKKLEDNIYESCIYWGVCVEKCDAPLLRANNCSSPRPNRENLLGLFSSSENSNLLQIMIDSGYELAFSAGAGHKALKVITCEVDLYLLSKASTFKWDTCAPQAILRSLGGNVFNYRESVAQNKPIPLSYVDNDEKCNKGGLIALRDINLLPDLLEKLKIETEIEQ